MGSFPIRAISILLVLAGFVHFGTPLIADLFFELYHLTGLDFLYSAYGVLRYVTGQFMFWDGRWMVTLLVALLGLALLRLLRTRRQRKEARS